MTQNPKSLSLLRHLSAKPGHDEVKAEFRQLLISEFDVPLADVRFEQRISEKLNRRANWANGVRRQTHIVREWDDVERKMPDYLANRETETGEPFVASPATGGSGGSSRSIRASWSRSRRRRSIRTSPRNSSPGWTARSHSKSRFRLIATVRIEPVDSVAFRTGGGSAPRPLGQADRPEVALKRQLWAQLLKIVYGKDVESDPLWLQHTYLVVVAKCIAFAVLGLNEDDPTRLLSARRWPTRKSWRGRERLLHWIVADPDGAKLVRRIMAHVRRFRLAEVESDVMKTLYELLIDREQRHGLGEYYTPDWLAAKITRHVIDRPLEQKVLDPASGSATFLFHALRRFLEEAEAGDVAPARRALKATQHVAGMDIHPVAVIIAASPTCLVSRPR